MFTVFVMNEVLDSTYLPFTEEQLLNHFAKVRKGKECTVNKNHLNSYRESAERYHQYLDDNPDTMDKPLSETKNPCQIERDETFWTASCMMTIFYSKERQQMLQQLLTEAYGKNPPLVGVDSWQECLEGDLALFFEVNMPSPPSYKDWLRQNLTSQHFIPYILNAAYRTKNPEGRTVVDAILINPNNGFAVVVEAKVLTDISIDITYDVTRNQIARNVDMMLDENLRLCEPLCRRDPEKTLFLLLTPEMFKVVPSRRFYGYKFHDYKKNPESLTADLPHRKNLTERKISHRLGWLTWEDFHRTNKNCCPWVSKK